MKRICFIVPKAYAVFHPEIKSKFGGAEIQLYLLAKELSKDESFHVSLLVGDYRQNQIEFHDRIKVIKAIYYKKSFLVKSYYFFKSLQEANADIYIQTSLMPFSGIIALFCRMLGKKLIYRVSHDAETDGGYQKKDGFFKYSIGSLVFRCAYCVVVQNTYQANNLKKRNRNAILIPSATYASKAADSLRKRDIILWVGRYKHWKRPALFFRLAREYPEYKFVMICQEPKKNSKLFKLIREKAREISNLEFIEFVPFGEIDTYFVRAKIFVNTSVQEGFPNTFLQSCEAKTPIISYNVNPNGFFSEYCCGMCAQGNWQKFLAGFQSLLDENRANKLGLNAYEYAQKHHNLQEIIKQYKSLF